MYPVNKMLADATFSNVDFHPLLGFGEDGKTSSAQEDQSIKDCLRKIFDPNTADYKRVKLLDKVGGISKLMQYFGTVEGWGLQQVELDESKLKHGSNDSFIWNLISWDLLISTLKAKLLNAIIPILLVMSLLVQICITGFGLLLTPLYGGMFVLLLGWWVSSTEVSAIIIWIFRELWYTGNKRMSCKTFTIIREGCVLKDISKRNLICGDILKFLN